MPSALEQLVGNASAFPILESWDFFNHAGVSPIPHAGAEAMRKYALEAERGTYLDTRWYKDLEAFRASAAKLLNATREEIALVKNTGEGLSIVANGIAWKSGDRIVTTGVEYPSNIYPWMDIAKRFGVELVMVPEETDRDGAVRVPLEKILQALDHPRTRLLTISHVEYASGQRHDLVALGEFCRAPGILFCVDAIQTLGIVPVDVKAMKIDYLSADGHKWLLGPEGAGIFYIRRDLLDSTHPISIGWANVVDAENFGHYDFTFRPDAGRYECGSNAVPGFLALKASLEMLQDVGIGDIMARSKQLTDRLIAGLRAKGYRIVSPRNGNEWSGSVCFVSTSHDHAKIQRDLRKEHRTEIALRENRLRASPHFYNTEQQIDRLIEHLPSP